MHYVLLVFAGKVQRSGLVRGYGWRLKINKVVNSHRLGLPNRYLYCPKIKQFHGMNKNEESGGPASDIPVLLKIDRHFLLQRQVRSVSRFGKGCKITLSNGDEVVVNVSYAKVADLVG